MSYTVDEKIISELLVEAHNKYAILPTQHPSDINEWVYALHSLQKLLAMRLVRRDYPNDFYSEEVK